MKTHVKIYSKTPRNQVSRKNSKFYNEGMSQFRDIKSDSNLCFKNSIYTFPSFGLEDPFGEII